MSENKSEVTLVVELKNMVSTKMILEHIEANKGYKDVDEMEKMYDIAIKTLCTTLDNANAKLRCLVQANQFLPNLTMSKVLGTRKCTDWLLEDVYIDADHPAMHRAIGRINGIFVKGPIEDVMIPESHRLAEFIGTFFSRDSKAAADIYYGQSKGNLCYFELGATGAYFKSLYTGIHTGIFYEVYKRWCVDHPLYTKDPSPRGVTDMMQNYFKYKKSKCLSLGLIHDIRYKQEAKSQGYQRLFPRRKFFELFLAQSQAFMSWEHVDPFSLDTIRNNAEYMLTYLAQDS